MDGAKTSAGWAAGTTRVLALRAVVGAIAWLVAMLAVAQETYWDFDVGSEPVENPPLVSVAAPSAFTTEQQEELDRRWKEFVAKHPEPPKGLLYGYSKGFYLSSPEGAKGPPKEVSYLFKFNGRFQLRHTYFDSHGPNLDENQFEFERVFLVFTGFVHTPDLAYHLKLDGDSDEQEGVDLLDWFWSYDVGHALACAEPGTFGLRAGKWKVPFHRVRQESGFQLSLVDRSVASEFFDINRSIGVGTFGRFYLHEQPVNWEAAVFNGFHTQRLTPGRVGELDRNFACAARIFADVIGEWGQDGEPDLSWHDSPAVRVGGAVAHTRVNHLDAFSTVRGEYVTPRVCDSGLPLAIVLPAAVREYEFSLAAVDANFKYAGFSFLSEYYFRYLSDFQGAPVRDLFDHGFMLQAGYFICPETLELAARWSRVVGDSGTLGVSDRSSDDVSGGGCWYMKGHDARLTFDVTHLNGATVNSTPTNIRAGDIGWLFRTQMQIQF